MLLDLSLLNCLCGAIHDLVFTSLDLRFANTDSLGAPLASLLNISRDLSSGYDRRDGESDP